MSPSKEREFIHSVPKSNRSRDTITITFRKLSITSDCYINDKFAESSSLLNILESLKTKSQDLSSFKGNEFFELLKPLILNKVDSMLDEIKAHVDTEINSLKAENALLKNDIIELNSKIDDQEQYSKRSNLLLFGQKEETREDLDDKLVQEVKC